MIFFGLSFSSSVFETLDIIGNKNLSCNQVYQQFGAADEKLLADCANHTQFPSPDLKSSLLLVSMAP